MDFIPSLTPMTSPDLQRRWFEQSSGTGWSFASDWFDPAVEALCDACVRGEFLWPAAERLGAARASAGISLGETLADIDGLILVMQGAGADVLQRATSLGWADRMMAPTPSVFDPLTGLVSMDYLRIRLGEVYRGADVAGTAVSTSHAMVVVSVDLTGRIGWDRVTPLLLAGDAMRTVFDGRQTLARLADHMAVVLTEREPMLARKAQLLAGMIGDRLAKTEPFLGPVPRVWIESLPDTLSPGVALIQELGR